jgi:uncharacterized protein (DUF2344 family)
MTLLAAINNTILANKLTEELGGLTESALVNELGYEVNDKSPYWGGQALGSEEEISIVKVVEKEKSVIPIKQDNVNLIIKSKPKLKKKKTKKAKPIKKTAKVKKKNKINHLSKTLEQQVINIAVSSGLIQITPCASCGSVLNLMARRKEVTDINSTKWFCDKHY